MRGRLGIVITLIVVVVLLIALNAASYVRVEQTADSEESPDRSTLNSGATGTRALFDFLRESGYEVVRWTESPSALLSFNGPKPSTVVVVGRTIISFSKSETEEMLRWVEGGGRLIIIDRSPDQRLAPKSGQWTISTQVLNYPWNELDPTNLEQMTAGVKPVAASQPTLFSRAVETVLPSRFAGVIEVVPGKRSTTIEPNSDNQADEAAGGRTEESEEEEEYSETTTEPQNQTTLSPAPAVHFAGESGALLIDYAHGKGRIVVLSDPFVVANNGIARADNLILAVNVIAGAGGLIAFDEFHQGHGATHNALIQYFYGTPVLALCGQFALLGLAVIWSRGRRFARPLPLPQVDRRSSLEFVASMAELEQRAKAHDLALENIYARVRRVLVRYAGLNNTSPRAEIARRVAARSGLNREGLESLMRSCEDTINGAQTNRKEALHLARRLRQIEAVLGLRSRARDARQAAERIDL
jgi:hypothetical protein